MQYQFDVDTATEHGVEEATIIHNFAFWIKKNQANEQNYYEGYYWTYNSAAALQELFPFWTRSKISRLLRNLEAARVLKSGNYNKTPYDRTKWYTIIDKTILDRYKIHIPEIENGNIRSEQPIPDINTDKKTQIKNKDKEFSPNGELQKPEQTELKFEKEQPGKQQPKKPKTDYQQIIEHYYQLYQDRVRKKPIINGETGKHAKSLLKNFRPDEIIPVLEHYFKGEFWFTKKTGYDFRQFVFRYNEIQSAMVAHKKPYELDDNRRSKIKEIEAMMKREQEEDLKRWRRVRDQEGIGIGKENVG